jgi:RimJ/RimL family protein N-acetyltransferase
VQPTARLNYRPLTPADAEAVHGYQSQEAAVRYVPFAARTLEQVTEALNRQVSKPKLAEVGQFVIFGAWSKEDGRLIGQFNLGVDQLDPRSGSFGYLVHPDFWRQGYAFEASRELLRHAFADRGFHRVTAQIDVRNQPSINLAEKLGMRREATHIEHDLLKGELVSEHIYAILARDWRGFEG